MNKRIGIITHVFDRIGVAIVYLEDNLKIGDVIRISGKNAEFTQTVDSMQVDRQGIDSAQKGATVGIKVNDSVQEGDEIFLVE